jgi:hypothetical protein
MPAGYTIDKMANLYKQLTDLVGADRAMEWIKSRFDAGVQYGGPSINGHNTPYGQVTNLDVRPQDYYNQKPTIVPTDHWNSSAGGEYSMLSGIRLPERSTFIRPEQALVHESQHARDAAAGANPQNSYRSDDTTLNPVDLLAKLQGGAITGQPEPSEKIAQLRDYESRLPAFQTLQQTDFFKSLSPDQQAMIIRRFYPMPAGVDAVTGTRY